MVLQRWFPTKGADFQPTFSMRCKFHPLSLSFRLFSGSNYGKKIQIAVAQKCFGLRATDPASFSSFHARIRWLNVEFSF